MRIKLAILHEKFQTHVHVVKVYDYNIELPIKPHSFVSSLLPLCFEFDL